ncbi:MAG: isopenicillin N synthase family oxygenase [Oceanospirillaceae bacterium]|nr:isopenicillin N synthase family oxygenase [Oceanospirillaceae bacterium]
MNVKQVDYLNSGAGEDLVTSLHESGFAVLKNSPITPERITRFYQIWADFFASDEKHNYTFEKSKQDGYFPFRSENAKGSPAKDLKEFFHVYPWGAVPASIESETRAFYADLQQLGSELLSWIQAYTPESVTAGFFEPLDKMIQGSDQSLLRVLHYPPIEGEVESGAVRAAAHEDINLITLLVSGSQPGLEAKDKQGNWFPVTGDEGMITINTGDMLQEASGGYFPSTTHRVVNPDSAANVSRYSIPMFVHPRPDARLSERYTAGEYLQQRLREIGLI